MPVRILATLLVLLAASFGPAQDAKALLDQVSQTVASIEDASLLLVGRLVDAAGGEIPLEIEFLALPNDAAFSAYLLKPDALADNMIVLDGEVVANYTFLTHQVTLFDADDPDALGGLVEPSGQEAVDATFDIQSWFAGWSAELAGSRESTAGPVTVINMTNPEAFATVTSAEVAIVDETLLPYELMLFDMDGRLVAELRFENVQLNTGLSREDVTYLPEDAEVIDERKSAQTP